MKVLLTTNVFPPAIGGPATFGARLGEELLQYGHEVKVVCATEDSKRKQKYSFPVIRTGYKGNTLQREIILRLQLLKAVFLSDIVYCMGLEHQTAWACRVARTPYVLRIGGDSVWEGARNLGATELEPEPFYTKQTVDDRLEVAVPEQRRLNQLKSAVAVVYVSQYLKRLSGVWAKNRPVREYVNLNGISTNKSLSLPKRNITKPLQLLFIGRQTNWKGVDSILLAVKEIDNIKLTVAGSGPSLPANIDLSRRLNLGKKVNFLGHINPKEIDELMAKHHVLILPSLYEGLSNTLLEAGAAGLACIASNCGGNPEVITHNESGLLVDPFNVEELSYSIKLLLENENMRLQLAEEHRRKVVRDFSMIKSVQSTVEILEAAISL